MGEGGGGEEKGTSLPFSLPFFPFSPETPDTQANPSGLLVRAKLAGHCTGDTAFSHFFCFGNDCKLT